MEIAVLVAGIVGAIAGVAAAIYAAAAVKVASKIAQRQEELQRRNNALQACIGFRNHIAEWYETIREKTNPNLSPEQILANIEEGYTHRRFEQKFDTQLSLIKMANEPLCEPILNKADIFYKSVFDTKDAVKEGQLHLKAQDTHLGRLYKALQTFKTEGREQESREYGETYVEAAINIFQGVYFEVDGKLGEMIGLLSEKINQTDRKPGITRFHDRQESRR